MKEIITVPFESMPRLITESFLTNDQVKKLKDTFKDFTVVVRCKDCKHWRKLLLNRDGCGVCHADNPIRVSNQDWFCADGERKENVLYHCNCPHCGKDWWSENAFPHECSFCGKELT